MNDFKTSVKTVSLSVLIIISARYVYSQTTARIDISLDKCWQTIACDTNKDAYERFENPGFNDSDWLKTDIPHNWDRYEGYRRLKHGNRHGCALYRKEFEIPAQFNGRRIFLWFEGVGSYSTVWVNGKMAGYHAGGRTSFTLDITSLVHFNSANVIALRADHPAWIKDLPWVCGGCSDEWGFSEGSQPMGIFRPVHLVITDQVRIEPFGVHIWNDTSVNEQSATVKIETEIRNYGNIPRNLIIQNYFKDIYGKSVAENKSVITVNPGSTLNCEKDSFLIDNPHLWSTDDPYLYQVVSQLIEDGKVIDEVITSYGIRWIRWPDVSKNEPGQFYLNGKPVFINGTAEYEHNMGKSHAFSAEQIRARVMQVKEAGFNAFRDAHQPHNLRYQHYIDSLGLLWWPQFAAHIWFDNEAFRQHFKMLLTDWIKERRNSPSVILWGLENESTLPEIFASECSAIIRELDPTASNQRKITTCNGGTGTDWNVIQNWSGTYGGNPKAYAIEIQKQLLNGEYGAWRSIDLHTEGPFNPNGLWSEDRMTQLLEMKVCLAESVRDKCCGQFQWLLSSHENPGRIQNGEGLRDIDRVGPVNYKGLMTVWGEPLDSYYMYRAGHVSADKEPMVYIVSHTWPDRWLVPGIKDSIIVYSNCEEVELFNDLKSMSLGRKLPNGKGFHFQWDSVNIRYNILYATGYVDGKAVAEDCIILNHLPEAHDFAVLNCYAGDILAPETGYNYLYRVNCGGPDYQDTYGNLWSADRHISVDSTWGSRSWTDEFRELPAFYGSQRRTFEPVKGTANRKLFQTFRYGLDMLQFEFPVPDGKYHLELFFTEPWYGRGSGIDCAGWRIFDIAVNDREVIKNLDIWKEAGYNQALKKIVDVNVTGGYLKISFPEVIAGQAVISAIAVATGSQQMEPAPGSPAVTGQLDVYKGHMPDKWSVQRWLDTGDRQYSDNNVTLGYLPSYLYGCEWIRTPVKPDNEGDTLATFKIAEKSDIFIARSSTNEKLPVWMKDYTPVGTSLLNDLNDGTEYQLYSRRLPSGSTVRLGAGNDNEGMMYTVIIRPVTNIAEPSDQRPARHYRAESASISGQGVKSVFSDGGYLEIFQPDDNIIEWKIYVGLAGNYSFQINYMNVTTDNISACLTILNDENIIADKKDFEFPATGNRWGTITINSDSQINAGKHTLKLTVPGAGTLKIRELTVQ